MNIHIDKLLKDLTKESYEEFIENIDEYKNIWNNKGSIEFWIQYIISVREFIITKSKTYDDKCERQLVNFLKCLTNKYFHQVKNYMKDASNSIKDYKELSIHTSFYKDPLFDFDQQDELLNDSNFLIYKVLSIKLKCAGSLINLFALLKDNNYEKGKFIPPKSWFIPVDSIGPLENYIENKWGNNKDINNIIGCDKNNVTWWNKPLRTSNQLPSEICTSNGPPLWLEDIHTHIQWIFNNIDTASTSSVGKQITKTEKSMMSQLFDNTYPIILNNYLNNDNMKLISWYTLWSYTFSNRYIQLILKHRTDDQFLKLKYKNENCCCIDCNKDIQNWHLKCENDLKYIQSTFIKSNDCLKLRKDFLLDINILLRLPFDSVLFRQWLLCSLIEVMKIEELSLKLRYWPLTKDIERIARIIVKLILCLKQRIIFGWIILIAEGQSNINYIELIKNEIIAPSVDILEFICTDTCSKLIIQLYEYLEDEKDKLTVKRIIISPDNYTLTIDLNNFYTQFFGSFLFWDRLKDIPELKIKLSEKNWWNNILKDIKNNDKLNSEGIAFQIFDILKNEHSFPFIHISAQPLESSPIDIVKQLSKDYFTSKSIQLLEKMLKNAKLVTTDQKKAREQIIECTSVYKHIQLKIMKMNNKDDKITACLSGLAASFMLNECIIKMIAACSYLIKLSPISFDYKSMNSSGIKLSEVISITRKINGKMIKLHKSIMIGNENCYITNNIPKLWSNESEDSDITISSLETRLAKLTLKIYRQNCNFAFIRIIHYLLPSYINWIKNNPNDNIIKFMDKLLTFYEEQFNTISSTNNIIKAEHKISNDEKELEFKKSYIFGKFMINECSTILKLIMDDKNDSVLDIIFNLFNNKNYDKTNEMYLWYYDTWNQLLNPHIKIVYDICINKLNFPLLNEPILKSHNLHHLYFLYTLTCLILIICEINMKEILLQTELKQYIKKLIVWRIDLYNELYLINTLDQEEDYEEDTKIIDSGLNLLNNIINNIIANKKRLRYLNLSDDNINFLKSDIDNHLLISPFVIEKLKLFYDNDFNSLLSLYKYNNYAKEFDKWFIKNHLSSSNKIYNCSNCSMEIDELTHLSFIACQECIDQNFPKPEYYCSVFCKDKCWNERHKIEHLEFELGIL